MFFFLFILNNPIVRRRCRRRLRKSQNGFAKQFTYYLNDTWSWRVCRRRRRLEPNKREWPNLKSFLIFKRCFFSDSLSRSAICCLLPSSQFTFILMRICRSEATLWNRYENCILKCLSVGFCFLLVLLLVYCRWWWQWCTEISESHAGA